MATWICVLLVAAAPSPGSAAAESASGSPERISAASNADAARIASPEAGKASDSVDQATAPLGPRQLRAAVHEAMIQSAKPGPERAAAVRRLADLHGQIVDDTQMLDEDRDALERSVRARLKKIGDEIAQASRKQTALLKSPAPTGAKSPASTGAKPIATTGADPAAARAKQAKQPVSGQDRAANATTPKSKAPPAAASPSAQGGAAQNEGQELVDLIEQTIAPHTWQRNGGLGTIRYFAHGHSIVVRQTDQNHEELGELIQALGK